jgi:hypothetical protein
VVAEWPVVARGIGDQGRKVHHAPLDDIESAARQKRLARGDDVQGW